MTGLVRDFDMGMPGADNVARFNRPPIIAILNAQYRNAVVGPTGWTRLQRCPNGSAHKQGDRKPSFDFRVYPESVALKCFAGCTTAELVAALGTTMSALFSPRAASRYTDIRVDRYRIGERVYEKRRVDLVGGGKEVRWEEGAPASDAPLYRVEDLTDSGLIFVTEGEKDADALVRAGWGNVVAIQSASVLPNSSAIEPLRGRNVLLWPDDDEAGRRAMIEVAARLEGVAASIQYIVPLDIGTTGHGASEWVASWRNDPENPMWPDPVFLADVVHASLPGAAPSNEGAAPTFRWLDVLEMPPVVVPTVRMLHPTDLTILFGHGGIGKGNVAAWLIVEMLLRGETVMVIDYEGHVGEWKRRVETLWRAINADEPFPSRAVMYIAPLQPDFGFTPGGFPAHSRVLHAMAEDHGVTFAILDSVGLGALPLDGDISSPNAVSVFSAGLQQLGRPLLALSHSPKSAEDKGEHPFGSAYWSNLARALWNVRAIDRTEPSEDGSSLTRLVLACRKFSDTGLKGSQRLLTVRYRAHELVEVSEDRSPLAFAIATAGPLRERVLAILPPAGGPGLTADEIAKAVDEENVESVARTLRRLRSDGLALTPKELEERVNRGIVQRWTGVATAGQPPDKPVSGTAGQSAGQPPDNDDEQGALGLD